VVLLVLICIFLGFPICIPLANLGVIGKEIVFVGVSITVLGFFAIGIPIFPKLYAKTVYQVKIDTEWILFECIKPYLWSKPSEPIRVNLNDLKSFKYEPSNNFDLFRLRLKSGKKIRFYQYFFDNKDDFDVFLRDFRKAVTNYNKENSTITPIEEEKSIMENKYFLWIVAVIISVIFIGTILLLIFKGVSNPKGIIAILIVLGPLSWVITQVVQGLKKKSK
jgi:hypothetical protein